MGISSELPMIPTVAEFGSIHSMSEQQAVSEQDQAERWYALQTQARHEKMVEQRLRERGITTYLPLVTEVHRWSDRKKKVQLPLFSCYLFARVAPTKIDRLRILRVDGVFNFVGPRGEGTVIPDSQIDAVRALVDGQLPWATHPFLKIGQRVRIRSGALNGVEGILVSRNGDSTLVISVDAIQRSLSVSVEGYDVEAV
jgi:transcription antitermination factor NusG